MWITLTVANVKERFAGAEYNSVTAAALNTGQDATTLVEQSISRITNEVRGYIPSSTPRGENGTIPDELERSALALIVYDVLTRLPSLKALLTEERKDAEAAAREQLKLCSRGDFRVTPPETAAAPEDQPPVNKISVINSRERTATRTTMSGLT